ncbi:hypothetical protein BH10BAC5_BH10BAC5_06320 [soil metagenome]
MNMDLNYLKKLIKILDTSNLADLEIEEEGTKIKLSKPRPKFTGMMQASQPVSQIQQMPQTSELVDVNAGKNEAADNKNLYEVRSPMVGTFYRSPAPDADSYVNVGSNVSEGTVICIIEAMKLMNEIESEVSGKIVKVLVENAKPVEYNQPLFLVERI